MYTTSKSAILVSSAYRLVLACSLFMLIPFHIYGQVSISTTGTPPPASAVYAVNSITKGLLIPRMTGPQRNAIPNPAEGLLVYDFPMQSFYYFRNPLWTSWKQGVLVADADTDTRIWVEKNTNEDMIRFDLAGDESLVLRRNVSGVVLLEPTGTNCITGDSSGIKITSGVNHSLLGYKSGIGITTGSSNAALGNKTLYSNTTGGSNIAIGQLSLYSNTTLRNSIAVGDSALYNTNGAAALHNTAIGHAALFFNSAGYDNSGFGFRSGYDVRGNNNISLGAHASYNNYFGDQNSVAGYEAGFTDGHGDESSICGAQAGATGSFQTDVTVIGAGASYHEVDENSTVCGSISAFNGSLLGVVAFGRESLSSLTSGGDNVGLGYRSLYANSTGARNTVVGDSVMFHNTTGLDNTVMGKNALKNNTIGKSNTVIGNNSIGNSYDNLLTVYSSNVCIGANVMEAAAGNHSNVASGKNSLSETSHDSQIAIGDDVLTEGGAFGSTAIGSKSMTNSNAESCTALGTEAMNGHGYAPFCAAIGVYAMRDSYGGDGFNTSFGAYSQLSNFYTENTTAFGYSALRESPASEITGFGYNALSNVDQYTNGNDAFGSMALESNTTGENNTSVGKEALESNTFGDYNIAIGYLALTSNTGSGEFNIAMGSKSLENNTTGDVNVAIGFKALNTNTSGGHNVAIGYNAGYSNTTSEYNTAIGYEALYSNTTGINRTAIGRSSNSTGTAYDNSIGAGDNADCSASDQARLGDNSVTTIGGYSGWTNFSDRRIKKDITDATIGLNFILDLRPVTYKLDIDAIDDFFAEHYGERDDAGKNKTDAKNLVRSGFIAQEVEAAAVNAGYDFSAVDKPKNNGDFYGLRYEEFSIPLINSVKEQQQIIEANADEIEKLKSETQQLIKRLEKLEHGR